MSRRQGGSGMGPHKHGTSGYSTKSPRARFHAKMEAERNEIKDRTRIKDPASSVAELMRKKNKRT